jgi:type III restriction enzyme
VRPEVNAIAGRLSLRPPQRRSLEILDRVSDIVEFGKDTDLQAALETIRSEFPSVADFEREFPSLCFALATGVGKTRLMGAFIAYLHQAHGIDNFFVLAPGLTVYNKLIADFTPGTPKYVFKGIAAFANVPPEIINGDNYESRGGLLSQLISCKINIFNIAKINSEVRGGRAPRIRKLSEYIGQSYFDYLSNLPDLVLLMDESHRYRASAGVRAINELRPILGLELTATPSVDVGGRTARFRNVIFDYPLGKAMEDGYVKEPAVVTRKDFNPAGLSQAELELVKLEDGIRLHEQTKVELETYARENSDEIVKPFVLVIARDIAHAKELQGRIKTDEFFGGRYKDKVIQVDSSTTGAAAEEAVVQALLNVERYDEPTEIVIHVNMLKEGWDVTNLYTIVPLRAANARVLIEQSIGRGLRLPYGKRTGVTAVDRLTIVAHDKFQELIDEANRPDSVIRLTAIEIDPNELQQRPRTVVAQPSIVTTLGIRPDDATPLTEVAGNYEHPTFTKPEEQLVAQIAYREIQKLSSKPDVAPGPSYLAKPEIRELLIREVKATYNPSQPGLEGIVEAPDIEGIVAKTAELVVDRTIPIPRIMVVPQGEVTTGFHRFDLDLTNVRFQPPEQTLWLTYLRTNQSETIGITGGGIEEPRPENYIVRRLIEFDDVAYDACSDVLYELAGQMVRHLKSYLSEEETVQILRFHEREIARLIHSQMEAHYWEDAPGYEVRISRGYTELKPTAFSQTAETIDFKVSPTDKSKMASYLFGGFSRCLYPVAKFHSEPERVLTMILERDALKWFRPVSGQFQLYYRFGGRVLEYRPDFVAETADAIYMLEPKRASDMNDAEVLAKRDAAVLWCERASEHARQVGEKPWTYALIPHDAIATNMTLGGVTKEWAIVPQ